MSFQQIKDIPKLIRFVCKGKRNLIFSILILFLNLLASLLEGGSFACIFLGFSFLDEGKYPDFALLNPLFDRLSQFSVHKVYAFFVFAAIALQIMRSSLVYGGKLMASKISVNVQMVVQQIIFNRIFSFSYSTVSTMRTGDLMELSLSPSKFVYGIIDASNRIAVALLMAVGYIIFMGYASIPLTGCILCLFLIMAAMQRSILSRMGKASKKHTKAEVQLSAEIAQNLEGQKEIHIFHRYKFVLATISRILRSLSRASFRLDSSYRLIDPINEILSVLLVGFAIILSLFFLKDTHLSLTATILTFMTLTYRLGMQTQVIMSSFSEALYYLGPINRVKKFLSDNDHQFLNSSGVDLPESWEKIELNSLTFKYPKREHETLNNISFGLNKGDVLAIVGHSGAGKSTLINLLLRLYEPTEGAILIDGRPASDFSLESYRALFATVSQDAFLFSSTIADNISFGKGPLNLPEVIKAAKKAHAHDFIMKLPKGYYTHIGEKGYRLSGGERQRIALARALFRKSDILLLDEATSHLDSVSEKFIQQTITELKGEKTIVLVAHRLSTVIHADSIVVMENGTIIERGTHEELLEREGHYQNFWALQGSRTPALAGV